MVVTPSTSDATDSPESVIFPVPASNATELIEVRRVLREAGPTTSVDTTSFPNNRSFITPKKSWYPNLNLNVS